MKIRYTGKYESKSSCGCAGNVSSVAFKRFRTYYLPSGNTVNFRVGQVVDLLDSDGKWLLETESCFEEVTNE